MVVQCPDLAQLIGLNAPDRFHGTLRDEEFFRRKQLMLNAAIWFFCIQSAIFILRSKMKS